MNVRSTMAALSAALLLGLVSCAHRDTTSAASPQITKCVEELNSIPGVAALRKSRNKPEQVNEKPFEGLELALTIDDMVTSQIDTSNVDELCYTQDTPENLKKLLNALASNDMPPTVAFIEGQYFDRAVEAEWLRRGNLLGNFTYDRRKAKKTHGQLFVENIAEADRLLASVWQEPRSVQKYFRHPHPKISDTADRALIAEYCKQNGYVQAPVTIESPDTLFTQMYCGALAKGNTECASLIKANFFSLLLDDVTRARDDARAAAGREIKHVLAIRASQLTIDSLAELLGWFRGLGARFIPLDEALRDQFYSSPEVEATQANPRGATESK